MLLKHDLLGGDFRQQLGLSTGGGKGRPSPYDLMYLGLISQDLVACLLAFC